MAVEFGYDPLLSVSGLSVSFVTDSGVASVLDEVNFAIAPGEIMGLVGESGCGKTTLARAILGVLPSNASISRGSIQFQGRDLLKGEPSEIEAQIRGRAITFIPQDPFTSFSPLFTIGQQIDTLMRWKSPQSEGINWKKRGKNRERVLNMLRAVQLPDPERILKSYPHEVSGGQRQRLMIAMALLPEPRLVIADEPTTALDVTIQSQILKLLRKLCAESGASVLFTTHDLGAAWEICDRITVMYAGQEAETASVKSFFEAPGHPYTRKLIDSLPTEDSPLLGIPGNVPSPFAPPSGCRFHPRCSATSDACRTIRPDSVIIAHKHAVRCHHPVYGVRL
jgi:peptide/nickel transport system ATP-binding protein